MQEKKKKKEKKIIVKKPNSIVHYHLYNFKFDVFLTSAKSLSNLPRSGERQTNKQNIQYNIEKNSIEKLQIKISLTIKNKFALFF